MPGEAGRQPGIGIRCGESGSAEPVPGVAAERFLSGKTNNADALLFSTLLHSLHGWLRTFTAWGGTVVAMVLMSVACAAWPEPASAQAAPKERIEVRAAFIEPADRVYQLNATIELDLPEKARHAIRDGVALTLDVDIVLHRTRRFWVDETVATLEQHYELVYHALSERYLVRNLNSEEQASFSTLDAAIDSLRVLSNIPILDKSLVLFDARHEVSLRATVDVRTMPDALRFVLFWTDDWRMRSEWYTWSPRL
jgi:Domain of unknown function (DUF4390)